MLSGPIAVGELLDALDRGEVGASYRPVAHLATGSLVGWEAVARWDHPRRGVLRADSFAHLAEASRFLRRVEAAVVDAALAALRAADLAAPSSRPTMSVPLSLSTLLDGDVVTWLAEALAAHELAPGRLFVEVRGGVDPDRLERLAAILREVRGIGVRVTMTDVACTDSFTRLRTLPLDRLHLGACCTTDVTRPREQAIVRAVLALARDLAVDVVADGITTDEHDRILRRLGCVLGSGPRIGEFVPHLAAPTPSEAPPRGRRSFPVPANEVARLAALYESGLLDSGPEQLFDDIAAEAARVCDTPVAFVTLVDVDRVFFKAAFSTTGGDGPRDADRHVAFCAHAICEPVPLVVPDVLDDARFADTPITLGSSAVRFYAGAPLVSSDGITLGTVCVFDHRPRQIDDVQLAALRRLASHAASQVELRARLHQLDRARQSVDRAERAIDELRRQAPSEAAVPSWTGAPRHPGGPI